jgi:deoxyhypusine synthase
MTITKKDLLSRPVHHFDITTFNPKEYFDALGSTSFTSGEIGRATGIYKKMIDDPDCTIILTLAGSSSAAGCMQVYADMIRYKMVDVIVATGASIVDMDFFEALGFKHYLGNKDMDDQLLRSLYIDRIYDTFIDEEELQKCDESIKSIADSLQPDVYSSREFIFHMGRYLKKHAVKKNSLVELAYDHNVPVFCPAFSDCSAGFGLVKHQVENPEKHVSIDSVKDFRELTLIKMQAGQSGLFMIGGGVPKNFIQDTVICADILGKEVPMHQYAIQITVADVRDGACSSSTLQEAASWGKVGSHYEQMVYAEASSVVPLMISYLYHNTAWKDRLERNWTHIFPEKR